MKDDIVAGIKNGKIMWVEDECLEDKYLESCPNCNSTKWIIHYNDKLECVKCGHIM